MAGLTKVAWSPTIPASCTAGWAAAIASDPSGFSSATGLPLSEPRTCGQTVSPVRSGMTPHCRA
ncbi:hypothetical protein, partial [Paramuribaculum intestinale]|uniref:hypothetical protein n=1 Tax=Paramuribaculum intestinale TaxID=2094151 RepID=UPI0025B1A7CF